MGQSKWRKLSNRIQDSPMMDPEHETKSQPRRGWVASFRDIGCAEAGLAMLARIRQVLVINMVIFVFFLLLFILGFPVVSEDPWSHSQIIKSSLSWNFSLKCCRSNVIVIILLEFRETLEIHAQMLLQWIYTSLLISIGMSRITGSL